MWTWNICWRQILSIAMELGKISWECENICSSSLWLFWDRGGCVHCAKYLRMASLPELPEIITTPADAMIEWPLLVRLWLRLLCLGNFTQDMHICAGRPRICIKWKLLRCLLLADRWVGVDDDGSDDGDADSVRSKRVWLITGDYKWAIILHSLRGTALVLRATLKHCSAHGGTATHTVNCTMLNCTASPFNGIHHIWSTQIPKTTSK